MDQLELQEFKVMLAQQGLLALLEQTEQQGLLVQLEREQLELQGLLELQA
jgi:hypothetical protein